MFREPAESYTRIPNRTAAGTLSMIRAVIVAAPSKPRPLVKARLGRVRDTGLTLQLAWIAVNRPSELGVSLRALDLRDDRAWRLLRERMLHWVEIKHKKYGQRAQEIDALLYPTGTDFLGLKYEEQWSECERRLELISADELEQDLAQMIHPEFMAELRDAHAIYGEALGITSKRGPAPDAARVIDTLRAARKAIAAYARMVYALAEEDEEAIPAAEQALEPILRYRVSRVSTEDKESPELELELEPDEEPGETPLPALPGEGEGEDAEAEGVDETAP